MSQTGSYSQIICNGCFQHLPETISSSEILIQEACRADPSGTDKHKLEFSTSYDEHKSFLFTLYDEPAVERASGDLLLYDRGYSTSDRVSNMASLSNSSLHEIRNPQNLAVNNVTPAAKRLESTTPTMSPQQSDVPTEVEQLRLELQTTVTMYKRACEELIRSQNEVRGLLFYGAPCLMDVD